MDVKSFITLGPGRAKIDIEATSSVSVSTDGPETH